MLPDRLFVSEAGKLAAIVARAAELHAAQRPVLIGTRSVAISEVISERLAEAGLPHRVLNARQDATEAEIVALAGQAGAITVATNMAGRGTDIALADVARAAGGLHVLATERHEAGRIDRQLFGRAARQGDPGSCECMLSLEDALVSEHAPRWLRLLARAMASGDGRLPGWSGEWLFTATQRRVERQHSRIRGDLLDMDEKHNNLLAFAGVQE
jgi:preprotein translocase subunit SecA